MSTNALFLLSNFVESGVVEASTETPTAPATNVQNSQRSQIWRSDFGGSSYVDITLPAARDVSHVAIVDTNITVNGTIQVEAWDDAIDGATQTVDTTVAPNLYVDPNEVAIPFGEGAFGSGPFGAVESSALINGRNITLIALPADVTSQFFRITFADDDTSWQQAGVIYLANAEQFAVNIGYGWQASRIERSGFRESLGGQRYVQQRDGRLVLEGTFEFLTDAERTRTLITLQRFGEFRPLLFSIIPQTTDEGLTATVYGTLRSTSVTAHNFSLNRLQFQAVEEL